MNIDLSTIFEAAGDMVTSFLAQIPNIGLALVVMALFYGAARLVKMLIKRSLQKAGLSPQAGDAIGRIGKWATLFFGVFTALAIIFPSLEMATVIGSLGIGSVAIGFAFRDILQNFFAGILLLVTEPFKIGDAIEVEGVSGTVRRIETRATTIHTFDGTDVIIPNSTIFTDAVQVYTAHAKRRYAYTFGVGYEDNVAEAMELIRETIAGTEGVLEDPAPQVYLDNLGDSTVDIGTRWWINQETHSSTTVKSEVLQAVYGALVEADFDLPFPTSQVLFQDLTQEAGEPSPVPNGQSAEAQPAAQANGAG